MGIMINLFCFTSIEYTTIVTATHDQSCCKISKRPIALLHANNYLSICLIHVSPFKLNTLHFYCFTSPCFYFISFPSILLSFFPSMRKASDLELSDRSEYCQIANCRSGKREAEAEAETDRAGDRRREPRG